MPESPSQTGPSLHSKKEEDGGVKKGRSVGTEKVGWKEDLKYRDLESCQEKVRAGGLVGGVGCFGGRQDLRKRKLRV